MDVWLTLHILIYKFCSKLLNPSQPVSHTIFTSCNHDCLNSRPNSRPFDTSKGILLISHCNWSLLNYRKYFHMKIPHSTWVSYTILIRELQFYWDYIDFAHGGKIQPQNFGWRLCCFCYLHFAHINLIPKPKVTRTQSLGYTILISTKNIMHGSSERNP